MSFVNHISHVVVAAILIGILLLASCAHPTRSKRPQPRQLSVEERLQKLEDHLNAGNPPSSADESGKEYEANLAEIHRLGLFDRAQRDFHNRLPNATITSWGIGYFVDTNTVWCDVQYTMPDNAEILYKGFGYTRKLGTDWSLIGWP